MRGGVARGGSARGGAAQGGAAQGGAARRLILALGLVTAAGAAPGARDLLVHRDFERFRLLGTATARARGLPKGIGMAGSADAGLWLTAGRRLYEVREGRWLDPGPGPALADLEFLGGDLLATRGDELVALDRSRWRRVALLPAADMRLVARQDGVGLLLFGGRGGGRSVYQLQRDATYVRRVEVDVPVTAVAELAGELLVAAGSRLFHVGRDGRTSFLLQCPREVFSAATDPRTGTPMVATQDGVYAVAGTRLVPLLVGATGVLRHDGRALLVMDPGSRRVLALRRRGGDQVAAGGGPAPGSRAPVGGRLEFRR